MATSGHLLDADVEISSPALSAASNSLAPPGIGSSSASATATADLDDDSAASEEGEEEDEIEAAAEIKVQERRKIQKTIFQQYARDRAIKLSRDEVNGVLKVAKQDATTSIKDIMARAESKEIIKTPRDYQMELFERAKKQNTIAVLDTGSGKTLIAVLLLKHILDEELEARAEGGPHRVSFFLVDSVALVYQQYAVLDCNLDKKIAHLSGDDNTDTWKLDKWQAIFRDNMVIVCTAEILNQCLGHSFVSMEQINLLIFDEAHHAKKDHPYARIIKDYYHTAKNKAKIRIFGMTASPVDSREDIKKAATRLEKLLDARIATASDLKLLQLFTSRPKELVVEYERLRPGPGSGLYQDMQTMFPGLPDYAGKVQRAREARIELGDWCADEYWRFVLDDEAARKAEQKLERQANKSNVPLAHLDAQLNIIKEAEAYVKNSLQRELSLEEPIVSHKIKRLHDYLCERFEKETDVKCIIFVEKRSTARVLLLLLKSLKTECLRLHFRPGILMGGGRGQLGDSSLSVREQLVTLDDFRRGKLNCLVSTSVAEEGLDVPDCNLIIRFNLYKTVIQYIQSRGRARHATSQYLHFIEKDNRGEILTLRMSGQGEALLRDFCAILPEDRLLNDDRGLDEVLGQERAYRKCTNAKTGATLSYHNSLNILAHFISTFQHSAEATPHPEFHISTENRKFICEVILPQGSPFPSAIGRAHSRKSTAQRSAAYEACLKLWNNDHLDENLVSKYTKLLPAMRNAHLALDSNSKDNYDHMIKPSLWKQTRGTLPTTLFVTIFELEAGQPQGHAPRPLALLTRTPLPQLPSVSLYLKEDERFDALLQSVQKGIWITDQELDQLDDFTLTINRDVFNKIWIKNTANMSYWFAPVAKDWSKHDFAKHPKQIVDWSTLAFVSQNDKILWTSETPLEHLLNSYIVDRGDGGRRWVSLSIEPSLRARDPVPAGIKTYKKAKNILDFSDSTWKGAKSRTTWLQDQPVFRAQPMSLKLNLLTNGTPKKEKQKDNKGHVFLCPQPLNISALPIGIAVMCYTLPSIMTRLESYLIALEGCQFLGLGITPELALEAFTKDSDNTEEHGSQQINLQRGMVKNYERLEFIGDCFLKMATSISLFSIYADHDEYFQHVDRMLMVCNKNLLKTAVARNIFRFIRSKGFDRHTWYFEGIEQSKERGSEVWKESENERRRHHKLGDKTIADVAEALIGASLLSQRESGTVDMAVRAVTLFVDSEDHKLEKWADYYPLFTKPGWMTAPSTTSQKDLADQIFITMGYRFQHPRLLRSAFIHPSYPFSIEKIPTYQRLEFLGDALFDMVAINWLYHANPDKDPQWLTEHKMAMVSNKFLAALSVKLGFHKHMRYNGAVVQAQIRDYVIELADCEKDAKGSMDYWTSTKLPPKALSDLVEAYVGAIFVDSEFDYHQVEIFFDRFVQPFFADMSIYDTFANNHPTTYLHHALSMHFACQDYRLMASELPAAIPGGQSPGSLAAVVIHNTVVADAMAESSKRAKVKASQATLNRIKGISPYEFRGRYGCDCERKDGEEEGEMGKKVERVEGLRVEEYVDAKQGTKLVAGLGFTNGLKDGA